MGAKLLTNKDSDTYTMKNGRIDKNLWQSHKQINRYRDGKISLVNGDDI